MTNRDKNTLMELSKEQLIYLIEQLVHSQFMIGEVCVDESKMHISSERAVEEVRKYLYDIPSLYDAEYLKSIIDVKMGKISVEEWRKIVGLD